MVKKFWIVVSSRQGAHAEYSSNTRFESKEDAVKLAGVLAAKFARGFVVMEAMDLVETIAPPLTVTPIRG